MMEFPDLGFEVIGRIEQPRGEIFDSQPSPVNAEIMDADDVMRLFTWVVAVDSEYPEGSGSPYFAHFNVIVGEVARLPERDTVQARKVWGKLATSELPLVRGLITLPLKLLMKHDPGFGVMLWDRLLRDPNEGVRRGAFRSCPFLSTPGLKEELIFDPIFREVAAAELAEYGLTIEIVNTMRDAYEYAELGINLCEPSTSLPDIPLPE